jgi:hypothetical protein
MRTLGCGVGGYRGGFLEVDFVPDATFKSELDTLISNKTNFVNVRMFSLTFSNDYEITSPADGAIPDGVITGYIQVTASPYYRVTGRLFSYIDQNSARHTPVGIHNLPYSGTIALQDSVIINGTTYAAVDDGGSGGWGAVIATDVPTTNYVDVLF